MTTIINTIRNVITLVVKFFLTFCFEAEGVSLPPTGHYFRLAGSPIYS